MLQLRHWQVVAAAVMVMPRARSCTIQSNALSPSSTLPSRWMRPLRYRIASEVVVFPASMWAKIPMTRTFVAADCLLADFSAGKTFGEAISHPFFRV